MPENPSDSGSKENRKRERSTRRPPVFAVLLLAGFLLLVLSFITFRQLRSGEANRLRLLAGFAEQVEATVPELVQRFVKVVDEVHDPEPIEENLANVPNVTLVAGGLPSTAKDKSFSLQPRGPRVYLRYDTFVPPDTERGREQDVPADAAAGEDGATDGGTGGPPTSLPPTPPEGEPDGGEPQELRQYLGLLDLAGVVRPIVIPDVFDLLVLARRGDHDNPSAVLFQQGQSELKLAEVAAAWEVQRPGMLETVREAWREGEETEPSGGGTRVVEAEIAGTDYRVFVQPVTLHLLDGKGNPIASEEWVACGVISWQRLLSSSFSTSPVILFLMVALLPLMAICWPFLKMWLISRRQEFTRFDVAALVFSCFLGLALVTLLVLDFAFVSEVESVVDEQLRGVAHDLETNLTEEIEDAADVLGQVGAEQGLRDPFRCIPGHLDDASEKPCPPLAGSCGPNFQACVEREAKALGSTEAQTACLAEIDTWTWVRCQLDGDPIGTSYPFLHAIFWIDAAGDQAFKVPFKGDSVLRNRVADRDYFECPKEPDRAASYEAGGPTALYHPATSTVPFVCVQSIRSKTTAGDLAVLSMPVAVDRGDDAEDPPPPEPVVAALSTRFVSLTRPLLPAGVSFAIVDRAGDVVFHSDTRRNQNENFLRGAAGDRLLASMLARGREGAVDLNYWGNRYRAWVHPLGKLPWTLITLRDRRDLRTRNFEVIYDFLNPFLTYTVFVAIACLVCLWFVKPTRLRYLWPWRRLTPAYRDLCLFAPFVVGVSAKLAARGPTWAFGVAFLSPVALFAWAIWRCRHYDDRDEPVQPESTTRPVYRRWERTIKSFRELGPAHWLWLAGVWGLATWVALDGGWGPFRLLLAGATFGAGYVFVLLRRAFEDHTTVAPYLWAVTLTLLVVAVLPAAAFFQMARERQVQLFLQDGQVHVLREEARLWAAVPGDLGRVRTALASYKKKIDLFHERTIRHFFDSGLLPELDPDREGWTRPGAELWPYSNTSAEASESDGDGAGTGRVRRWLHRLISARPVPLDDLNTAPTGTDLSRFAKSDIAWWRKTDDDSGGRLRLAARWETGDRRGGTGLVISSRLPTSRMLARIGTFHQVLLALAGLALLATVGGFAAFLAKKIALIDLASNRRHAAIGSLLTRLTANDGQLQRLLVRTSLPAAVARIARDQFKGQVHVVPFAEIWSSTGDETARQRAFFKPLDRELRRRRRSSNDEYRPLLITDFRIELKNADVATAQIELLERLQRVKGGDAGNPESPRVGRSIMIVTSHPFERLVQPSPGATDDEVEARNHWGAFLASFGQRHARDEGRHDLFVGWIRRKRHYLRCGVLVKGFEPDWFKQDPKTGWHTRLRAAEKLATRRLIAPRDRWIARRMDFLLETLIDECCWTWRLQRAGTGLLLEIEEGLADRVADADSDGWSPPTRRQLLDRIGIAAHPYYQRIWNGCEDGEKQVLHQLAKHGVANPKSFDDVLDLLNKGLVVRTPEDPTLRIMNRSFAAFVRRTVRRREVWRWEEAEGLSAWEIWKWVLPVPLLLLGGFLFMTQQDAVSNVVGLVIAVASLAPTGINLYQHFDKLAAERTGPENG